MVRVMVIGNAGGGKSTLCRRLSAVHGLPHLAVDDILWRPGWRRTPEPEFLAAHEAWLDGGRWLIDGFGSWESVERRLAAADTIILVDLPFRVHLWRAAKRQAKAAFGGRPDGPDGCPMLPVTFRLLAMMRWFDREMRPKLLEAVRAAEAQAGGARVIRLPTPREMDAFAANPV